MSLRADGRKLGARVALAGRDKAGGCDVEAWRRHVLRRRYLSDNALDAEVLALRLGLRLRECEALVVGLCLVEGEACVVSSMKGQCEPVFIAQCTERFRLCVEL